MGIQTQPKNNSSGQLAFSIEYSLFQHATQEKKGCEKFKESKKVQEQRCPLVFRQRSCGRKRVRIEL